MGRPASDFTTAVRQLLKRHGLDLTHAQARPMLAKMGFELVPEQDRKSEDLIAWEQAVAQQEFTGDETKSADVRRFENAVGEHLAWTRSRVKVVLAEIEARKAWKAEINSFDVTKHNWKKRRLDARSIKPTKSGDPKARTAARVARTVPKPSMKPSMKITKSKKSNADLQAMVKAFTAVEAAGGVAAVLATVEALKAEIDQWENQLELCKALRDRVNSKAA